MSTFETLSFYRGVSAKYPTAHPYLMEPRRDRRPKDSSINFHNIADNWFKSRFGVSYRSGGLFVMSKLLSATAYAETPDHVMRIVPLSQYQYCWSPNVSDLLFAATEMATAPEHEITSFLDSSEYCEDRLQEAFDMGHEVMLYCDRYIAIPVKLISETPESNSHCLVLI